MKNLLTRIFYPSQIRKKPIFRPNLLGLEDRITPGYGTPTAILPAVVSNGLVLANLQTTSAYPDIVSINTAGNSVSAYLQTTAGTFTATASWTSTITAPIALQAIDINHDGKMDLVVLTKTQVAVYLGTGTGTFGAATTYALTGTTPTGLLVGDFGRDGEDDVVVTFSDSTGIIDLFDGTSSAGALGAAQQITVGAPQNAVAGGDFYRNGIQDLALATTTGRILIVPGTGVGAAFSYGTPTSITVASGDNLSAIAAGDINNDDKIDLVVADSTAGTVTALKGNGGGGFTLGTSQAAGLTTPATGLDPVAIALSDTYDDGWLGAVVLNNAESKLNVLVNNESGTLLPVAPQGQQSYSVTTTNPTALAVGDVYLHGEPDILVGGSTGIYLYKNNSPTRGLGTFTEPANGQINIPQTANPFNVSSLSIGDFNRDGNNDVAVANNYVGGDSVGLLQGAGNGYFSAGQSFTPPNSVATLGEYLVDLNRDGVPDLIAYNASQITIYPGLAAGGFGTPTTLSVTNLNSLQVLDLNGDGLPDLVGVEYVSATSNQIVSFRNTTTPGGTISFAAATTTSITTPTGNTNGTVSLTTADINHDSLPDLIVTSSKAQTVQTFMNTSTLLGAISFGAVAQTLTLAAGTNPATAIAVDLDRDGNLDLVVTMTQVGNAANTKINIYKGVAGGTFTLTAVAASITVGASPTQIVAADLNGDGKPDLVVGDATGSAMTVLTNASTGTGNFTFSAAVTVTVPAPIGGGNPARPSAIAVGRLTNSGLPALLAATQGISTTNESSTVTSYLENTNSATSLGLAVSGETAPYTATAGVPFSVKITALIGAATDTRYTGTVTFTSSDPNATLPANYTFIASDDGTYTLSGFTLVKAGSITITAKDTTTGTILGTATITVSANVATHIAFTQPLATYVVAGAPNVVIAAAEDAYGNIVTSYRGTVTFSSSDPTATFPVLTYTYLASDNGVHTFGDLALTPELGVVLNTQGLQTLTLTDSTPSDSTYGITGTCSTKVEVPSQFVLGYFPSSVTAGSSNSLSVTVEDQYGDVLTGYTGKVSFTSSDPLATLPASYTFTSGAATTFDNGVHTFTGIVLDTAGTQTVTVTDSANGVANTLSTTVVAAGASTFQFTLPSTVVAGAVVPVTVTAYDVYGNIATGYTGSPGVFSSDPEARLAGGSALPAYYTFTSGTGSSYDNGIHTFDVQFFTAGNQSLSVSDYNSTTLLASHQTTVTDAPASKLNIIGLPSTLTAGTAFNLQLTVADQYGNIITGYTGTIQLTANAISGSNMAIETSFPTSVTFTAADAGTVTLSGLALDVAGLRTITATSTTNPTLTSSVSSQVSPSTAKTLSLTGTPSGTVGAGSVIAATIQMLDAYGNLATGFTGSVKLTSSDPVAQINGNTLPQTVTFTASNQGQMNLNLEFGTVGAQTLTATATANSALTSTISDTVVAGTASTLKVTGLPNPVAAGQTFSLTLEVVDPFGNLVSGYTGSMLLTANAVAGSTIAENFNRIITFTAADAGVLTVPGLSLEIAGNRTISINSTSTPTVTSNNNVVVDPAAMTGFNFVPSATGAITAGGSDTFTATAVDMYGNVETGYTGEVSLTSSDSQAQYNSAGLPALYTFTSADAGQHAFTVMLATEGNQSVTITDTSTPAFTKTATDQVIPGSVSNLKITGAPATTVAGNILNLVLSVTDAYKNPVTGFTGSVNISLSSPSGSTTDFPSQTINFIATDGGSETISDVQLTQAGSRTFTAQGLGSISNLEITQGIVVSPGVPTSIVATPTTSIPNLGQGLGITFQTTDAYGNLTSAGASTILLSSSQPGAAIDLPTSISATNGTSSVSGFSFVQAGTQSITAQVSGDPALQSTLTFAVSQYPTISSPVVPLNSLASLYLPAPASTNESYIKGLYRAILGRDADSAGLANWMAVMAKGGTPAQVATALWDSSEHRTLEVEQYYEEFLGRKADPSGLANWVKQFMNGATEATVVAGFFSSPELTSLSNMAYINAAYEGILGRPADAAGAANWLTQLNGGLSKQKFIADLLTSREAADLVVCSYYQAFLGRAQSPDYTTQRLPWINNIVTGTLNYSQIAIEFLSSPEFLANAASAV